MKQNHFSEEHIIGILKEQKTGLQVLELSRAATASGAHQNKATHNVDPESGDINAPLLKTMPFIGTRLR